MSKDSPADRSPPVAVVVLFVCVSIGVAVGAVAGGLLVSSDSPAAGGIDEDQASVSCSTFQNESGGSGAICFVYGDVEFEWSAVNGTRNATNGTVYLDELPAENATVRRTP